MVRPWLLIYFMPILLFFSVALMNLVARISGTQESIALMDRFQGHGFIVQSLCMSCNWDRQLKSNIFREVVRFGLRWYHWNAFLSCVMSLMGSFSIFQFRTCPVCG